MWSREVGVQCNGVVKELLPSLALGRGPFLIMPEAALICLPCTKAIRRLAEDAMKFGIGDRWPDCCHDGAGYLILYRENILDRAVVALGPHVIGGLGFDKLCDDPDPSTTAAHAAFQHVAHTQFARDLPDINRAALVG